MDEERIQLAMLALIESIGSWNAFDGAAIVRTSRQSRCLANGNHCRCKRQCIFRVEQFREGRKKNLCPPWTARNALRI